MSIDAILFAKKFSGSASAIQAEAAATRAENAASNIPDDFVDVLTTMTEFQNDLSDVKTSNTNISNRITTVEGTVNTLSNSVAQAVATANAAAANSEGLVFTNSGTIGDEIRSNGNGTYYYGKRPITLLQRFTIPANPLNDSSDINWITNGNNVVTGFEITTTDAGVQISSLNMKKCLITVTNIVNDITQESATQSTSLWDIKYTNSTQEERNYHGAMYHAINYDGLHQLCYELGINPAGTAYIDLETGTSTQNGQMFPGGAVEIKPRRYCLYNNATKINAITMRLLVGTFTPSTVVRIWQID